LAKKGSHEQRREKPGHRWYLVTIHRGKLSRDVVHPKRNRPDMNGVAAIMPPGQPGGRGRRGPKNTENERHGRRETKMGKKEWVKKTIEWQDGPKEK